MHLDPSDQERVYRLPAKKLGRNTRNKRAGPSRSLPSLWHSCQRSGRTPALPYPLHELHQSTTLSLAPSNQGTFLLCRRGDISTLP